MFAFRNRSIPAFFNQKRVGARRFAHASLRKSLAVLSLAAFCGIGATVRAAASGRATALAEYHVAIPEGIDGIIVRGRWHARIALGPPSLSYVASESATHAVLLSRVATTLTIVRVRAPAAGRVPELRVSVPHLRGVAVSGAVDLMLDVVSRAPLFLDLSGSGTVRARGRVSLLRVTTSGGVTADLTALDATIARVHARQHSRLAIRARDSLTIVALDSAHVTYAARTVHLTARNASRLTPL